MDGPTAHGRHRRGTDLTRELRADVLTQDNCCHEREEGRKASRMNPSIPILRSQIARDNPGQTQGELVETCTILTTEANELMRPIHDRMPVIPDPAVRMPG